jgi:spore cortex biosynthesis protein YabQ
MMSEVIHQEMTVFLLSILHGIALAFLYDLLRCLRRTFRHGTAAVAAEDFLFWLTAAFLTFLFAFFETGGVIRGYVAAGIVLGAVFYHFTASTLTIKLFSAIFRRMRVVFRGFYQIIWKFLKKTCLFLKKPIEFIKKRGYNVSRNKNKG